LIYSDSERRQQQGIKGQLGQRSVVSTFQKASKQGDHRHPILAQTITDEQRSFNYDPEALPWKSMSRTYKATGINLKAIPLGESDRLLTILTREYGLVRVAAAGARKTHSPLGGRTGLFVVNELLIAKGRSLDKLSQADTLMSYPGISKQLPTLAASQYLAELVLYQALSDQPQIDLFDLLCECLAHLEQAAEPEILPLLAQGVYHLLYWGGIAPQVWQCCLSQQPLLPNWQDPDWRAGFSLAGGGTVSLTSLLSPDQTTAGLDVESDHHPLRSPQGQGSRADRRPSLISLTAIELALLQQLSGTAANSGLNHPPALTADFAADYPICVWISTERLLRHYAQYHLDRSIRSAALIDACFSPLPSVL
jgi:DNA repair protein RecO (recombination protein O)